MCLTLSLALGKHGHSMTCSAQDVGPTVVPCRCLFFGLYVIGWSASWNGPSWSYMKGGRDLPLGP